VYASSANVYAPSAAPLREDDWPAPGAFYGRSKYVGELLVEAYAQFFSCTILRLFTVYGSGQTGMLIPQLIEGIRIGKPVQVEGRSGLQLSPIHVADVCQVFQSILEQTPNPSGVFNVGGDQAVGIGELAEIIARVLGTIAMVECLDRPEPGGWVADCSRLRARFDLGPFRNLEQGLRETVDGHAQRRVAG
jgi:nucleoside-diphosphate-sugar epimerase